MEFLVHISVRMPVDLPSGKVAELQRMEQSRAASLASDGRIARLWRVPGTRSNWGLWRARDASELHEAIASLPLWPYMEVEVTPLASHANDPAAEHSPGQTVAPHQQAM